MATGELRRLKQLEDENCKLKQRVADLSLDKHILQDALAKNALTPARRRELVHQVQEAHGVSEGRGWVASASAGRASAAARPSPIRPPLRMRICDLAKSRVRYGDYRIHILLRREGWRLDQHHKRVHRLPVSVWTVHADSRLIARAITHPSITHNPTKIGADQVGPARTDPLKSAGKLWVSWRVS